MKEKIHENLIKTEKLLNEIKTNDTLEYTNWIIEKTKIKYTKSTPSFPIYNNFIYWCNLGINIGSEQNKLRPIIVVKTSFASSICTIIPLTSKRLNDKFLYHIDLEEIDSTALLEQLRVVSKLRFVTPYRKRGSLVTISEKDWSQIDAQLKLLYKLRPLQK